MKKISLSADHRNNEEDVSFWWNRGCESIAAVAMDSTGLRFDGTDFTVIVDHAGQSNERVRVLVNDIVVFSSVRMGWNENDTLTVNQRVKKNSTSNRCR